MRPWPCGHDPVTPATARQRVVLALDEPAALLRTDVLARHRVHGDTVLAGPLDVRGYAFAGGERHIARVDVSAVTIPRIEIPRIEIPRIEIPRVDIPRIQVPKISIPSIPTVRYETGDSGPV